MYPVFCFVEHSGEICDLAGFLLGLPLASCLVGQDQGNDDADKDNGNDEDSEDLLVIHKGRNFIMAVARA